MIVDPLLGRIVGSTWRLDAYVARGSMGTVYRGANVKIGTPVAVKVLNPEFLQDPVIRERFRREAMVSSKVTSNHLVRVFDLCTEPDGYVFIIMEWLSGMNLAEYLSERAKLYVGEVVTLTSQVGEGLEAAHRAKIVHRDIKPGNIFLERSALGDELVAKIVDFGLSKILEAGAQLTAASTMMGTPHYMPVEQFNSSSSVDARADVYALGVIAYEALAGHRPFRDGTPVQILNDITTRDPDPLPDYIPATVSQVVMRAMAREREARWQTAASFVSALQEAAAADGVQPRPLRPLAEREDHSHHRTAAQVPGFPVGQHAAGHPAAEVSPPAGHSPSAPVAGPPPLGPAAYLPPRIPPRPLPSRSSAGWLLFALIAAGASAVLWLMAWLGML